MQMLGQQRIVLAGSGLCKSYGKGRRRRQVLFDIDIEVQAGECVGIIGASGSGKSTLSRLLMGLEQPDSGDLRYLERSIVSNREARRQLQEESSIVYQQPFESLDPRWRVRRSVAEPLRLRGVGGEDCDERVAQVLRQVWLEPEEFANRYPMDLSGGQAQRVAIARALMAEPKVMLADEAMSAIDVTAREQILEVFEEVRAERPDMAMVMVSHDLGVVQHIADRIVVLRDGRVVEHGTTANILDNPREEYTRRLVRAATW